MKIKLMTALGMFCILGFFMQDAYAGWKTRNKKRCKAWCAKRAECKKCAKSVGCGIGYTSMKKFGGRGKNWFACKKTKFRRNSEKARNAAAAWCRSYQKSTSKPCRIIKSGKACKKGWYRAMKHKVSWGRDYGVCLKGRKLKKHRIKRCSGEAYGEIIKAFNYLEKNYHKITKGLILHKDKKKSRRRHRWLKRNLRNSDVKCHCKKTWAGYASHGAVGNNIHICYRRNKNFCELVNTVIHEVGHKADVQKNKNHNSLNTSNPNGDLVYLLGNRAGDFCKNDPRVVNYSLPR